MYVVLNVPFELKTTDLFFEEQHGEPKVNTIFVIGSSWAPKSQFYSLLYNVKLHLPIAQVSRD